jgi:DNA recombination protein RmuC
MTTLYILLAIIIVLLIILTIKLFTSNANDAISNIASIQNEKLNTIAAETTRIEESVKKEISLNRIETNNQSLRARQELAASLQSFEEKLNHLT